MKKTAFLFMFLVCEAFCLAAGAPEKDFSAFASVRTIESRFSMAKYTLIADKPLVSEGFFYFQSPDKLFWAYEKPYSYGFLIDGDKIFSWRQKDGKRETRESSSQPGLRETAFLLQTFVSMDIETISKSYAVQSIDGGILLLPKNKSKKQAVRDIKIFFAEHAAAVREVVICEHSGDSTVIAFTDTKIDGSLPRNAFTI